MTDIVKHGKRDIWEVANQLGGYVGPDTPERLKAFLLKEEKAAADLAREILSLRSRAEKAEAERDSSDSANTHLMARVLSAEATCEKLAAALEPFANEANAYDPPEGDDREIAWDSDFTIGSLRVARSCLSEYRKEASE